ncbi:MAG: 7-cyano-7-deazaguanine synthase QueC [Candidatus Altiarchaeota archaeon]
MGGEAKAVILLSGGMDSAVTAYKAKSDGNMIHALTVNYGQRHTRELESAVKIAESLGVEEHKIVEVDPTLFRGSALTDYKIDVPEQAGSGIPVTYVPARNTIMLSLALAYAETINAGSIYAGMNAVDYSGYPDCRPEYIQAFQELANLATKRAVEGNPVQIRAPLVKLSKKDIVNLGSELNVPFQHTWSCYNGRDKACGRCDSCRLRLKGFEEAGMKDPVDYERH